MEDEMKAVLENFHKQVEEAAGLGKDIGFKGKVENIIVTGIGGSTLSGDILGSYLNGSPTPIHVNRDYELPKWAGSTSLVIAISYSGNTEEPLSAYRDALSKNCLLASISSGGKLKELAEENGKPHVDVPKNYQPRMAYAYLFFPMLNILKNSGLMGDMGKEIEETVAELKDKGFERKGKSIAGKLTGRIPIIYSSESLKAVAYKWKINFNENPKIHAFYNVFPELNHNEMVGYTDTTRAKDYFVVILSDEQDHERIKKRMKVFESLITEKGFDAIKLEFKGKGRLARIFSSIHLGDWVSYLLAKEYGVDPIPVEMVEKFKKML